MADTLKHEKLHIGCKDTGTQALVYWKQPVPLELALTYMGLDP